MAHRRLLVALHDRSWGRTAMALRVAHDLVRAGDEVLLLVHGSVAPLLDGTGLRYQAVADHLGPLVRVALDCWVSEFKPNTIIYFDYLNTCNYLDRLGVDSGFLLEYDAIFGSLDTWDQARTGHLIDFYGGESRSLANCDAESRLQRFAQIENRLIPVPISSPFGEGARFQALAPEHELGLAELDFDLTAGKRVLFCTSPWQHPPVHDTPAARIARSLPELVACGVAALGPDVQLVHVGPEKYRCDALPPERYHWRKSLSPGVFGALLNEIDLFVTANVAATTALRAMRHGLPVVVLRNSEPAATAEELRDYGSPDNSPLLQALPLDRFHMWPLGYHHFLAPLLNDNPYCDAVAALEVTRWRELIAQCGALLRDRTSREASRQRQSSYLALLDALPDPAHIIQGWQS